MPFYPGTKFGGLSPTSLQLEEHSLWQGSGFTSRQDPLEPSIQLLSGLIPKDGDMPDPIEMEAVGGEFGVRGAV
jgi:hypothetical protein